ncbi:WEB family protein At4g27595, chloroplastic-like [Helianthus annuus]|uniref:WEB family protein At4g27595, chloroplastic-like n=1 Tax=Helianthus annuus TaxID=4232 RepID=UPI000B8FEF98|nr:WEB family protein At4g27595, chloroplastic-like [Helianthus annuus]
MENEFYNAFASPMTVTQNAWEHTKVQYSRPVENNRVKLAIRDLSVEEKKKYKDEKMMVSLLQHGIKEDILILLQHNESAQSIWTELESKFLGSDEMMKNKKSLLKKEFDLFRGLRKKITKYLARQGKKVEEEVCEIKKQDKEIPVFEVKKEAVAEKVTESCENCEIMKKQNSELIHNLNKMKESYDVLNKAMNQYNESSSEQATAMKTLKGAYMRQLDSVSYYTEMCAELENKLEIQRIETERVNRIYPIVESMKTFQEKTFEEKKPKEKSEEKDSETKEDIEEKTSGTSVEKEQKSSFWKQMNKEFLAKKQEEMKKEVTQKKMETRTCFNCHKVGHIARNCLKAINTQQEVSLKLKEKVFEISKPPTKRFKVFENSTFEVGECSKKVYNKKVNLDNRKWIVKKSKTFDVEKSFNPNVKHIFGKMIDGKVKGVKEFYEKKMEGH